MDQRVVRGVLQGGDPGYDETAVMLAECALSLVFNRTEIPLKYSYLINLILMIHCHALI